MKEAQQLADALKDGVAIEGLLATEIEKIICDLGDDTDPLFDTAFRFLIREHRAHVVMMRARLAALVQQYNLK